MKSVFAFMIFLFAIAVSSCSQSSMIVNPESVNSSPSNAGEHQIAASGMIVLDEAGNAIIEPSRDTAFHYNVTSFLQTACPGGCLDIRVISIIDNVWIIELTLENPTSIQVYDVRIIYYSTAGKKVLNPDGYIDLYGKPVSPFTAFAKEYPNRAFPVGPGGTDSEILELLWLLGQPVYVGYLIDVSVGGNCEEPYKISGEISNAIPHNGGQAIVSATVFDWQNDPTDCFCNWVSLGGYNQQMILVDQGAGFRDFEVEIVVLSGYPEGKYPLIIEAREYKPQLLHLYDIVVAEVKGEPEPIKLSGDGYRALLNFTSKTVGAFGEDVYVIWSDNESRPDRQSIYIKEYRNGEWLDKFHLSESMSTAQSCNNPSIAVNASTGDLHVLWESSGGSSRSIIYRPRKNHAWGATYTLFEGAFCMDSQIDVENNNEIHIVFQDADGPFLCIYWIHDPGTGAFEAPFVLAESYWPGDPYYAPAIDHDHMGYVHVPFMTGAGGANNIGYRLYNGTSWGGLMWLTSDLNSFWPDITVAPNRKATMIFRKDDGELWMKAWTGSWELGEHIVTNGADIYGIPNCDCDSKGNIHLAYCGESDGDKDIYYMVYSVDFNEWSETINLSHNDSDSKDPSLCVGPDDKVHVVWDDNLDGEYGVYYVSM